MSSRANKPDTQADINLRTCLGNVPPRSFIMKAGAGSGKTTSLIKCLSSVIQIHGGKLKRARQRVACITYTEIAAGEIWRDVGNDPLVHVSTIHSFMWLLAKPFQNDIRGWVSGRIAEKIASLEETQATYGPRIQQRTRDKDTRDLERLRWQSGRIAAVKSFRYGTGSNYAKGILGHDDILKIVPHLIAERPLFRTLIAQQFPFVFVDESQDTTTEVVEALKIVEREPGAQLCLGFFGDPMQRIYVSGTGLVDAEPTWAEIPKPENFRCSTKVLNLANAIRRDGDDLIQVPGHRLGPDGLLPSPEGSAHLFILPADDMRDANLIRVREWMAARTGDDYWLPAADDQERVKLLVIVHQMAARRLGFGDLYTALNSRAPSAFKDNFLDGSAWPISPCVKFLIPIAIAHTGNRPLEVMRLIREYSPLLAKESLDGVDIAERLKTLGELVTSIAAGIMGSSNITIGDLLRQVHTVELLTLDTRLVSYLDPEAAVPAVPAEPQEEEEYNDFYNDESEKEIAAMDAFLACPASQLLAYQTYISERSPFWTQQGIKGAEFDRVLVVLDDAESTHVQFSYEKYLGLKAPSGNDQRHIDAGEETTKDRTRRLFYVSCTRALKDLAVVLFTEDPESAEAHIRTLNLFEDDSINNTTVFERK
ncbi:ATP-dependent helicase [Aeromonas salmonicida subsp. salmonicida]|uniref:UvrD-helicase domain-containing protein n=1 Tax=Aeromonas sobria TaxID=646 RepID=UPI00111A6031|nr:UvrD-helicase domain-containing protein [Aeromonas sobria]ELI6407379.1 ATP-dependent helicase [Aeromonas salmonicida subsp. salmonicida]ELI6438028.1 ATP-dependent helicase [Aeromonas salmonicida subsp. salmonicida]ELM3603944.1 ATP-dependent helicase [Aeromonas salmonicida subsp. salmonicida]ELM3642367.1 ATP-dependent helicase [Aeromonas salmonicida subsp. salmonicida]ELM3734193.1 ATP-dependent helicase [Aeromonas salmonicida subsp. salmonicida]